MTQIDYLETLKAIRMCVQNPRHRVGIFMPTMREAELMYIDAIKAIFADDEERNAIDGCPQRKERIAFNNGSTIQFLRASENARGCRFDAVLYGQNIDDDILRNVVGRTEFRVKRK